MPWSWDWPFYTRSNPPYAPHRPPGQTIYTEPRPGIRPGGRIDDSFEEIPPGTPPGMTPVGDSRSWYSGMTLLPVVLIVVVIVLVIFYMRGF